MTKSTDFYRSSHCIMESTRRGGRQGTGRSGNKSSARQCSVRSTLPRRNL